MAYATDTRTSSRGPTMAERFAAVRTAFAERRAQRRVYIATRDELGALSDRELSDLGLSRTEIRRVAFEAAYGK